MEHLLGLILSLLLKPAVLVITIILMIKFYKRRDTEPGFNWFAISMLFFTLGELACAIDVYVIGGMTTLNEGLHDLGMSLSFSIFFLGAWTRYTARAHCFRSECHLYETCRLKPAECKIFLKVTPLVPWSILGLIVVASLVLPIQSVHTTGAIDAGYGDTIVGSYYFDRSPQLQILQHRVLPLFSMTCLALSALLILWRMRLERVALYALTFGIGTLAFVYFRFMMIQLYDPDLLWTGFAEEILELLSVIYIWMFFRSRFALEQAPD